jgi:hypothetical protein
MSREKVFRLLEMFVLGGGCATDIDRNKLLSILNQSIGPRLLYPGVAVCETPSLHMLTDLRTPRVVPSCSTSVVVRKIRNALGSAQHLPSHRQLTRQALRSVEGRSPRLVVGIVRPAVAVHQCLPSCRQTCLTSVCPIFAGFHFWPSPYRISGSMIGVKGAAVAGRKLLPLWR